MSGLYLPGAAWRPISYRGESGLFAPGHPLGYIPHVQVGTGSLWATFEHAVSPDRKFSNAWIAKDGRSEQYAETNRKPWAQVAGNGDYLAFECEGDPSEPYTLAQINTLATWHNDLGMPDLVTDIPGGRGVGTHVMGGAAYGGHTCPGPGPRAGQRPEIIARALVLRGAPPLPPVPHPAPVIHQASGKIVLKVDGDFGPQSRMRLQQWAGVAMDSVLGVISWKAIQRKLGGLLVDGDPGAKTWSRIQQVTGAHIDGIPGPVTYTHLQAWLNNH